jgi:hypothetical protein
VVCACLILTDVRIGNAAAADFSPASRECEIKAAFLYNFTKFIEWPTRSPPDTTAPFVIGVLGDSPCAEPLERLVRNRKVNGRAITVRRVESIQDASATHILFVGNEQEARFGKLEPAIEALPILTVGESSSFASMGGAINFVLQDDKVRFEINTSSADHAGVRISAQLLKLATAVHRSER